MSLHRYIRGLGRCNLPQQTFIEKKEQRRVEQICEGSGRNSKMNLCISDSTIKVYHLSISGDCEFDLPKPFSRYVIVACDKIGNVCHPVHVDGLSKRRPNKKLKTCR